MSQNSHGNIIGIVIMSLLLAVAKYLTRSNLQVKGSFWLSVWGIEPIIVEKAWGQKCEARDHFMPQAEKKAVNGRAQLMFSFVFSPGSNPWANPLHI